MVWIRKIRFGVHRQAKGNEIQTANLKLLDEGVTAREGEKVPLSVKELLPWRARG